MTKRKNGTTPVCFSHTAPTLIGSAMGKTGRSDMTSMEAVLVSSGDGEIPQHVITAIWKAAPASVQAAFGGPGKFED